MDSRIFLVIAVSALVVVCARIMAPFEVEKDQAIQLEAAQRLANGLGLTGTSFEQSASDITEAVQARTITWFPPALSVAVAVFLHAGLPLLVVLKTIYGAATVIGWIGWAVLASRFLTAPLKLGSRAYHVRFLIAALMPVFVTPVWQGTDVLLWAGIPFFALLLARSVRAPAYMSVVGAGLICGLLYSVRYASLFLFVAALFVLAAGSLPRILPLVTKGVLFGLASLVLILPTVGFVRLNTENASLGPEYVDPAANVSRIPRRLEGMLAGSHITSNLVFGHSVAERLVSKIDYYPVNYAVGIGCLLAILLLPIIVWKSRAGGLEGTARDTAIVVSLMPLSVVIFLAGAALLSGQALFGVRRYHGPVSLCAPLVFYGLAIRSSFKLPVRAVSSAIVILFALYLGVYMPAQVLSSEKRSDLVERVLSYSPPIGGTVDRPTTSKPVSYLEHRMYSRKENSRETLKKLHEASPNAIFFVLENYAYYVYDRFDGGGPVPGLGIKRFPVRQPEYLDRAYTSRDVRVYWVLDYPSASVKKSDLNFVPESNLKTVFFDAHEKTLILESEFPAGYRLNAVATAGARERRPSVEAVMVER